LFLSLSNYDFGVILSPSGQGSLSAKTEFVGQRHTLPISRVDTIEVSTLLGCLLRDVTSMYYSRLQSYGRFTNISLSMIFTLFPCISLYFYRIEISIEKAFILQIKRTEYRSIELFK